MIQASLYVKILINVVFVRHSVATQLSHQRSIHDPFSSKLSEGGVARYFRGAFDSIDDVAENVFYRLRGSRLYPHRGFESSVSTVDVNTSATELAPACGVVQQITSKSSRATKCPSSCPLWAERKNDDMHCNFACIAATPAACSAMNPKETIPDPTLGICRSCNVQGCKQCFGHGLDKCRMCSGGYRLNSDGFCDNEYEYILIIVGIVLLCILAVVIAWAVDLFRRPVTNKLGLQQGLTARSRAKLHMPKELENDGDVDENLDAEAPRTTGRTLWPLTTNLLTTDVAGPGIVLQFNFQMLIIIWAGAVALGWWVLSWAEPDFLILGTKSASTPRQNCIIVAWGYETQQRLMPLKVQFVLWVYIISFIVAIAHAIRQLRMFQSMDVKVTSHKDFCAMVTGLPEVNGDVLVEEQIADLVEKHTGIKVVGVSVAWDFNDEEGPLMDCIDVDLTERETKVAGSGAVARLGHTPEEVDESTLSAYEKFTRGFFNSMEKAFLSPTTQKILRKGRSVSQRKAERGSKKLTVEDGSTPRKEDVVEEEEEALPEGFEQDERTIEMVLKELSTGDRCFIIFNKEEERNDACEKIENMGGLDYEGGKLLLTEATSEPGTVLWANCVAGSHYTVKVKRMCWGIFTVFMALFFWCVAFYLPYAYYVTSFNYSYGNEPPAYLAATFSMVVCLGNVIMYFVCSCVADGIGFSFVDHRETCYMLLYAFACTLNVLLDLVTTYFMAYRHQVGLGMKTYHGVPLQDLNTFTEKFETYAMQKDLGKNLLLYAWPSTFLLPFIFEPIATIFIPYKIMSLIVGSHPEYPDYLAEEYLHSTPMDLSRYSDLLLNVMLAVLIFYFPGGFTMTMFLGMCGAHIFIYLMDSYRVLRAIPYCCFANNCVDWWAQWMLSVPIGLLLSCTFFKSNCEENSHCWDGWRLVLYCSIAFCVHVVVHTIILLWVVPLCGLRETPPSEEEYDSCSARIAASWFNMNPVHVLRSQHIYQHSPPHVCFREGKEHLLEINKSIGANFGDDPAEEESYETTTDIKKALADASAKASKMAEDAHNHGRALVRQMSTNLNEMPFRRSVSSASEPSPAAKATAAPSAETKK